MSNKYFTQYQSPNIIIVPTVSFVYDKPSKPPDPEKVIKPNMEVDKQKQDTITEISQENMDTSANTSNAEFNLKKHENIDKQFKNQSWASNYMQSIGQNIKPIKLNLSLSKNKINLTNKDKDHSESEPIVLKNDLPTVTNHNKQTNIENGLLNNLPNNMSVPKEPNIPKAINKPLSPKKNIFKIENFVKKRSKTSTNADNNDMYEEFIKNNLAKLSLVKNSSAYKRKNTDIDKNEHYHINRKSIKPMERRNSPIKRYSPIKRDRDYVKYSSKERSEKHLSKPDRYDDHRYRDRGQQHNDKPIYKRPKSVERKMDKECMRNFNDVNRKRKYESTISRPIEDMDNKRRRVNAKDIEEDKYKTKYNPLNQKESQRKHEIVYNKTNNVSDVNFDLRSKITNSIRKKLGLDKTEDQQTTSTSNDTAQDDIIITKKQKREEKAETETSRAKSKSKKCKKLKFTIKVVCQEVDSASDTSTESDTEVAKPRNVDLSFLDDFNIDEIVDSLKHSRKGENACQQSNHSKQTANTLDTSKVVKSDLQSTNNQSAPANVTSEQTCNNAIDPNKINLSAKEIDKTNNNQSPTGNINETNSIVEKNNSVNDLSIKTEPIDVENQSNEQIKKQNTDQNNETNTQLPLSKEILDIVNYLNDIVKKEPIDSNTAETIAMESNNKGSNEHNSDKSPEKDFPPGNDIQANAYRDAIDIKVELCDDYARQFGSKDLSVINISKPTEINQNMGTIKDTLTPSVSTSTTETNTALSKTTDSNSVKESTFNVSSINKDSSTENNVCPSVSSKSKPTLNTSEKVVNKTAENPDIATNESDIIQGISASDVNTKNSVVTPCSSSKDNTNKNETNKIITTPLNENKTTSLSNTHKTKKAVVSNSNELKNVNNLVSKDKVSTTSCKVIKVIPVSYASTLRDKFHKSSAESSINSVTNLSDKFKDVSESNASISSGVNAMPTTNSSTKSNKIVPNPTTGIIKANTASNVSSKVIKILPVSYASNYPNKMKSVLNKPTELKSVSKSSHGPSKVTKIRPTSSASNKSIKDDKSIARGISKRNKVSHVAKLKSISNVINKAQKDVNSSADLKVDNKLEDKPYKIIKVKPVSSDSSNIKKVNSAPNLSAEMKVASSSSKGNKDTSTNSTKNKNSITQELNKNDKASSATSQVNITNDSTSNVSTKGSKQNKPIKTSNINSTSNKNIHNNKDIRTLNTNENKIDTKTTINKKANKTTVINTSVETNSVPKASTNEINKVNKSSKFASDINKKHTKNDNPQANKSNPITNTLNATNKVNTTNSHKDKVYIRPKNNKVTSKTKEAKSSSTLKLTTLNENTTDSIKDLNKNNPHSNSNNKVNSVAKTNKEKHDSTEKTKIVAESNISTDVKVNKKPKLTEPTKDNKKNSTEKDKTNKAIKDSTEIVIKSKTSTIVTEMNEVNKESNTSKNINKDISLSNNSSEDVTDKGRNKPVEIETTKVNPESHTNTSKNISTENKVNTSTANNKDVTASIISNVDKSTKQPDLNEIRKKSVEIETKKVNTELKTNANKNISTEIKEVVISTANNKDITVSNDDKSIKQPDLKKMRKSVEIETNKINSNESNNNATKKKSTEKNEVNTSTANKDITSIVSSEIKNDGKSIKQSDLKEMRKSVEIETTKVNTDSNTRASKNIISENKVNTVSIVSPEEKGDDKSIKQPDQKIDDKDLKIIDEKDKKQITVEGDKKQDIVENTSQEDLKKTDNGTVTQDINKYEERNGKKIDEKGDLKNMEEKDKKQITSEEVDKKQDIVENTSHENDHKKTGNGTQDFNKNGKGNEKKKSELSDSDKPTNITSEQQECDLLGVDKTIITHLEGRMRDYFKRNYKITSLIKDGKHSTLFKCKDSVNKCYAVKLINNAKNRVTLGVIKENLLKSLNKDIPEENQYIIRLFSGFGVMREWAFLMEYIPTNLQQVLYYNRGKPFNIHEVQDISRQLISAVMVLRNNNIVHSNIRATHILFDESTMRLKLCGFDESYYFEGLDILKPNVGSVKYRAPEIIIGYPASFGIDVWSSALIMYEIATRRKLIFASCNNDAMYQQLSLFGNLPYDMIWQSKYSVNHFVDSMFVKRGDVGTKKQIIEISKFHGSNQLYNKLFYLSRTHNRANKGYMNKLSALYKLLEKMLILDPRKRMPIEFVCADPFIYEMFT